MNNFQKAIALALIAMCFSYCADKPSKIKTADAGIALSVERDVLTFAIERRLYALENTVMKPQKDSAKKPEQIEARSSLFPIQE